MDVKELSIDLSAFHCPTEASLGKFFTFSKFVAFAITATAISHRKLLECIQYETK